MKELSRQKSLGMNFHDYQLEAWLLGALQVVCWLKSYSTSTSGLVSLSLAWGSGLLGPILKEPQCGNIGKQIESTLNCENPLVWSPTAKNTRPLFNFLDYRFKLMSSYSQRESIMTEIQTQVLLIASPCSTLPLSYLAIFILWVDDKDLSLTFDWAVAGAPRVMLWEKRR